MPLIMTLQHFSSFGPVANRTEFRVNHQFGAVHSNVAIFRTTIDSAHLFRYLRVYMLGHILTSTTRHPWKSFRVYEHKKEVMKINILKTNYCYTGLK